ncbi:MAG: ribulose-phosphate 3-epimerase, ribulose-phosphate 3-epimerase [Candidatus Gottesmanbacteria bacterium GW2011_GWA2_43_14]|uniref:Ribulose-phosphate 3-epimerase, ribulose-phosphate 3-epimerase n=1 Tax=Candidatus Gottesmanbacteria bacterium GW2011_GWA2_43_14 TaxID=1618443 RepID=A0A0G1DIG4_9BACT|nr:MAG: ribulose-phosphate 3-epimerase, ribulose-phosphate 3-epimerase [Candidatus Gottesmanbacteria bacterium GW2011_GWA2_43_14]
MLNRMVEVIPAILEKDFAEIERKIRLVENLVEWVQIDVADGILVPNDTKTDPSAFKNLKTKLNLEAHLMVKEPAKIVSSYADAGFKRIYAHIEADGVEEFMSEAYKKNVEVGLAIDGPTPYEKIAPYLDNIDGVLVMAIKAGFSGQPFLAETPEKIKKIHEFYFDLPICVDGAMTAENAAKVIKAGATRINSNSYLFNASDIFQAVKSIQTIQT